MNLFETETWRAFFPNFIAVVASIVLTFGTDRAIQEYNHRQDIREVIAVLKADARESFEYYRETADNCRRICASTDRIVRAGDRYDTLPPEMLGKFLTLLLEKRIHLHVGLGRHPETIGDDAVHGARTAVGHRRYPAGREFDQRRHCGMRIGYGNDTHGPVHGFPPLSRSARDTLPSGEGAVAAVRFVMEYPPCHNYTVKNPFGDLARSIEKSCADLEDALNRITEAGY